MEAKQALGRMQRVIVLFYKDGSSMGLFIQSNNSALRDAAVEQARSLYPDKTNDIDLFKKRCGKHADAIHAALRAPTLSSVDVDTCLRKLAVIRSLATTQFGGSAPAATTLFLDLSSHTEQRLAMRKQTDQAAGGVPDTPEQAALKNSISGLSELEPTSCELEQLFALHRQTAGLMKSFKHQSPEWQQLHRIMRFEILQDAGNRIAQMIGDHAIAAQPGDRRSTADLSIVRTPDQATWYVDSFQDRAADAIAAARNVGTDVVATADRFVREAVDVIAALRLKGREAERRKAVGTSFVRSMNVWENQAFRLQCSLGDLYVARNDLAALLANPARPKPRKPDTVSAPNEVPRPSSPERTLLPRWPLPAATVRDAQDLWRMAREATDGPRPDLPLRPKQDLARIERRLRAEGVPIPARLQRRASDHLMLFHADRRYVYDK